MPVYNAACDAGFYNNETLGEIRYDVLVRLGFAAQTANPPPGMVALLNSFIIRAQNFLYRRHRALRTERMYTWTMVPDERYYGLRDSEDECIKLLDAGRVTWVGVQDLNGAWYPLIRGIPPTLYTSIDSPGRPARYEIRQEIEIFPAPDAAYTLRVQGHFGLMPFVEDTDHSTIDSDLLFMWALANAKNHYGHPDAADVAAQAQTYLKDLVAETHAGRRYVPGGHEPPLISQPLFLDLEA